MTVAQSLPVGPPRVLVVDDEPDVARLFARRLVAGGFTVETACDGPAALRLLAATRFDAIVSDVAMPDMTGVELLRCVRERDLEVPVILATGTPSVASAAGAVEHGAYRYLVKPVDLGVLASTVESAVRMGRLARIQREALELLAHGGQGIGDRVGLDVRFERALATLWMAYQPIVAWRERRVYAYEALVRTREPSLPHPGALFDAATRLGRVAEVGERTRARAAADFAALADGPGAPLLFVNITVADLTSPALYDARAPLSRLAPRVVLEVTERASIDDVADVRARALALRGLGFRLAVDDLGAGYSGLNTFALLEPEVVKIDMSLVRAIDREPLKQRIVRSIATLCRDASILVVAEGIETPDERDTLAALGCDLMQGFLFARPAQPFPEVQT